MTKFLGLSGKAGHGKDTVAAVLIDLYSEYGLVRRAIADALKEDMFDELVYGVNRVGAWEAQFLTWVANGGSRTDRVGFINSIKHHPEVRTLLQDYGLAQRKAQPDYWIQRLFKWADEGKATTIVVPDCRFPNEAEAFDEVWRVVRPGYDNGLTAEQQRHPTETALDNFRFSGYIYNGGDIRSLRWQCQGNALEYYIRKGVGHVGVSANIGA